MRILLIKPFQNYIMGSIDPTYNRIWPPLCLLNCAALLEEDGHPSKGIGCACPNGLNLTRFLERRKDFDRVFITSSSLDKWQCPDTELDSFLRVIDALKKVTHEIYVMGYHATVKPQQILELTGAKAVIRGEPEMIVVDICRSKEFSQIDGITYKKEGRVLSSKERDLVDLNKMPHPAWHLVDLSKYYYELLGNNFILLEGSRGCRYSCTFCSKVMYGNKVRRKSIRKLVDDIKDAVNHQGARNIYFIDLEFTDDKKWVEGICEAIIDQDIKIKWCIQTRVDMVDQRLLEKMKLAGCQLIHYGVESGSCQIMESLHKGLSVPQIEKGIRMTKKIGIKTLLFFMFGFPSETKRDMQETVRFAKKLNPDYISFRMAIAYPNTKLSKREGIKQNHFPLRIYPGHLERELKGVVRRAYLEFYLRPSYIVRRLQSDGLLICLRGFKLLVSYISR